jgi:hypothetical protein
MNTPITKLFVFVICFFQFSFGFSQLSETVKDTTNISTLENQSTINPGFEIGIGTLTFYGDMGRNNKGYAATVSQIGYNFRIYTPINKYVQLHLNAMFGKLGSSERSLERNLNFKSEIRSGGLALSYNFGNFLKTDRFISPYISAGIESFEFLSKTDLKDSKGNYYNYWSDGSIRNLPENSPIALEAVIISRDYVYETDLRNLNLDGFGKYQERSWAIPIGFGANMHLTKSWNFRIGSELHIAFTDYVDNISDKSIGTRQGNKSNDKFLFTSAGINYTFNKVTTEKKVKDSFSKEDLIADLDDEDSDGVIDMIDECPFTPTGATVDEKGCPIDTDKDGVADYMDEEINTPKGNPVNSLGISLTDEDFLYAYLSYIDSLDPKMIRSRLSTEDVAKNKGATGSKSNKIYKIKIGSDGETMTSEMIASILSIPDVKIVNQGDTAFYFVGEYKSLQDAVKRKMQLEYFGIPGRIVSEENGKFIDESKESKILEKELKRIAEIDYSFGDEITEESDEVVFRVQIGAFKYKLSKNVFKDLENLLVLQGDDGLTRYVDGSFKTPEEAAKRKVELLLQGFEGAFLTAYQNSKRISLENAGASLSEGTVENIEQDKQVNEVNKELIKFRIQLGVFNGAVPANIFTKFMIAGNVKAIRGEGVTRYINGDYKTLTEANLALTEMKNKGFTDAIIVGDFNNKIIPAEEAAKLSEE